MDTSRPSVFVNGQLLQTYVGKRVRTVVQVIQLDDGVARGNSTDEKQLIIKGLPNVPLMNFVEVIGVAEGNECIHAETWTNFGNTFEESCDITCGNKIVVRRGRRKGMGWRTGIHR